MHSFNIFLKFGANQLDVIQITPDHRWTSFLVHGTQ